MSTAFQVAQMTWFAHGQSFVAGHLLGKRSNCALHDLSGFRLFTIRWSGLAQHLMHLFMIGMTEVNKISFIKVHVQVLIKFQVLKCTFAVDWWSCFSMP